MLLKGSLRERVKKGKTFRYYDPPAKRSDCMDPQVTQHAGKFYYQCCDPLKKTTVLASTDAAPMSTAAPSEAAVDYKNLTFVLRYTLEEVRKRWVAYKGPGARIGLGKGVNYTVSRSWFGKQRPSSVRLNPELNGSKMWVKGSKTARSQVSRCRKGHISEFAPEDRPRSLHTVTRAPRLRSMAAQASGGLCSK